MTMSLIISIRYVTYLSDNLYMYVYVYNAA